MQDVKVYSLAGEGAAQLSEHFKVREFRCRDGSDPVFVSPRLVEALEAVRAHFGAPVTVTSGYRTVGHNAATAGSRRLRQLCPHRRAGGQKPLEGVSGMESIVAALVSGAVTLAGVLIANGRSQAVTDTKLEELTREVRAHNNFAQRVPVLEEKLKVASHRLSDLERRIEQQE